MKKNYLFLITNIIVFLFLILSVEIIIWVQENKHLRNLGVFPPSIQRLKFHPGVKNFKFDPKTFPTPENGWGRPVEGLEYNKRPIVIFGCSYAYGYSLNNEQTFSYKLSKLAKVPVYNRAWTGWSVQHMLYQTKLDEIYKQIPEPEYVIYVYINDHIRRLYLLSFSSWNILADEQNLRYKEKNGELIEIKNNNPILKQIKRLYFVNKIHHLFVNKFILNEKNKKNCYDFAIKHFTEAKKEMQKHWKNTKYVIFFYEDDKQNNYLKENLKKAGFIIISSCNLTKENLKSSKYLLDNHHPREEAWDLLTPLIMKKLDIENEKI